MNKWKEPGQLSAFLGRIKPLTLPGTEDKDEFFLLPPKGKESWHLSPQQKHSVLRHRPFSHPISVLMATRTHPEFPSETRAVWPLQRPRHRQSGKKKVGRCPEEVGGRISLIRTCSKLKIHRLTIHQSFLLPTHPCTYQSTNSCVHSHICYHWKYQQAESQYIVAWGGRLPV